MVYLHKNKGFEWRMDQDFSPRVLSGSQSSLLTTHRLELWIDFPIKHFLVDEREYQFLNKSWELAVVDRKAKEEFGAFLKHTVHMNWYIMEVHDLFHDG